MSTTPKSNRTTHTPGPWTTGGSIYEHMSSEIRQGEAGLPIAQVWAHQDALGNARLIAAAPELLEALRELIAAIKEQHRVELSLELQLPAARRAIAKAEGR